MMAFAELGMISCPAVSCHRHHSMATRNSANSPEQLDFPQRYKVVVRKQRFVHERVSFVVLICSYPVRMRVHVPLRPSQHSFEENNVFGEL